MDQKMNTNELMNENEAINENEEFIQMMHNVYDMYFKHGARSNKKVNYFHTYIQSELEQIFNDEKYKVIMEYNVKSANSSGCKRCDIVILKNGEPYIIFPVKIIVTNFKQNKNNSWENLTGELSHIMWMNPEIKIIPINIYMDKTPYLNKSGTIQKYEIITFDDISNYNILKDKGLAYDLINYILEVEHTQINEKFTQMPKIVGFNSKTPFRPLYEIVKDLL
jgi:hypothetical protein